MEERAGCGMSDEQMNELVWQKVFGFEGRPLETDYCTSIQDAMDVVNALVKKGFNVQLFRDFHEWNAIFAWMDPQPEERGHASGPILARCISEAALKAIGAGE